MFNALSKLYEGKYYNWKMTLRTQLKNVMMHNLETIQSYFTRVSQIKEQLEAIGDTVEEVEIVMTTLNVLSLKYHPQHCTQMVTETQQCQQQLVHLQH
jgi:hypothetical protein